MRTFPHRCVYLSLSTLFLVSFATSGTRKVKQASQFPLKVAPEDGVPKYADIALDWSGNNKFKLSFADLAFELGLPETELEASTNSLADQIDFKQENAFCKESANKEKKTCKFFEVVHKAVTQKSLPSLRAKRLGKITAKNAAQMQQEAYPTLLDTVNKLTDSQFQAILPNALKFKGCPRNLSAAIMRRFEGTLPEETSKKGIIEFYKHADACLNPSDAGYEVIHFRYALLSHLWGDKDEAFKAINLAVQARDSDERARVLYWAGLLQRDLNIQELYWKRLTDEFPLTYHALEVWEKKKVDPMKMFSARPSLELVRNSLGSDDPADFAMRWLEALYFLKREKAAVWLSDWISANYFEQLSSSNILYISKLKSNLNTPLSTIRFLSVGIRKDPTLLNEQTLRILFPKHYFESFSRSASGVDAFLLLSVARQESGFNPLARSSANARGLLQLLPKTARRLSSDRNPDLFNPDKNITLGAQFLGQLIDRYGKVELALAAYNAGPERIPGWIVRYATLDDLLFMDLIPFKETRNYVSSILRNNYWYERLYRTDPDIVTFNKAKRSSRVQRLISSHGSKSANVKY